MKVEGYLIAAQDVEEFNSGFKKRGFAIETEEQYPQKIYFELFNDKVTAIDGFALGEKLDVEFNLRGRDWVNPQGEVKFFNTLNAWRVTAIAGGQAKPQAQQTQQDSVQAPTPPISEEDDDLPF